MTIPDAYLIARGRDVLPTALSSAEAREAYSRGIRARAVFSARTTSLPYLSFMRTVLELLLRTERAEDGESIGKPEARLMLKQCLAVLHYDSENGHFGLTADADIPPAKHGSLQDLASDRRLDLIIDTQRLLWRSAAQNDRGMEPGAVLLFPCWELVPGTPMEPRRDWPQRWQEAGGTLYEGRMIAPKGSPIWDALGNGSTFRDALDTETPPFAFGSQRRWTGVSRRECLRLGIPLPPNPGLIRRTKPAAESPVPAAPQAPGKAPAQPVPETPAAPAAPPPPLPMPAPQAVVPPDANPTVVRAVEGVTGTTVRRGRLTLDEISARSIARAQAAYDAKHAARRAAA